VRGWSNLPHGQFIVCTNHLGWFDPFLVVLFFPMEPRIYILADHEAVGRTGFRAAMMRFMQVVVTRDLEKPAQALRGLQDIMERGGSVLIFPEGPPAPAPQDGVLRQLSAGAGYLSVVTGLPILPVGLAGTGELWLRRTLRMRIGKPIFPQSPDGDRRARARLMTERLEHALRAILPPPDRTQPRFRPLSKFLTKVFT
jgi:1-acyl-sn-glycerol-3-phosphate acyltransferase